MLDVCTTVHRAPDQTVLSMAKFQYNIKAFAKQGDTKQPCCVRKYARWNSQYRTISDSKLRNRHIGHDIDIQQSIDMSTKPSTHSASDTHSEQAIDTLNKQETHATSTRHSIQAIDTLDKQ